MTCETRAARWTKVFSVQSIGNLLASHSFTAQFKNPLLQRRILSELIIPSQSLINFVMTLQDAMPTYHKLDHLGSSVTSDLHSFDEVTYNGSAIGASRAVGMPQCGQVGC